MLDVDRFAHTLLAGNHGRHGGGMRSTECPLVNVLWRDGVIVVTAHMYKRRLEIKSQGRI